MKKVLPLLFLLVISFGSVNTAISQTRKVVVEEGTGTWCQWCPRGEVYLDSLIKTDPDVIGIAVHGGDVMENTAYDAGSSFLAFPSGHISRSAKNQDVFTWFSSVATIKATPAPAAVVVSYSYNASTSALDVTVDATFSNATSGDYRLGAIVVEDGIIGTGPSYDQSNSYSGGAHGPMGGYENLPNPVPYTMMMYNHVGRELLGGYDGEPNSVSANVSAGSTHSHTFNYTVPSTYDPDYVYVVGVLIDNVTGEILNADKSSDYISGISNAIPKFVSPPVATGLSGSPYNYDFIARDPDDESLQVTSANLPSWLSLSDNGKGNGSISGTPPAAGTYSVTLTVSDGNSQVNQTFDIVVGQGSGINWVNVGTTGFPFSYQADYDGNEIASDGNGNIFVLIQSVAGALEIKQIDNSGNWNTVGSLNSGAADDFKIAAENGQVYLLYNSEGANWTNNNTQVQHFDGSSWSQLGSIIEVGDCSISDFGVYNNEVYVFYADAMDDGKVLKYDGSNWVQIGPNIGTRLRNGVLQFDGQGNPVVSASDYNSGNISEAKVFQYDGSGWNQLGGVLGRPGYSTSDQFKITVSDNGTIYYAISQYQTEQLEVYQWDGGQWNTLGNDVANGAVTNFQLASLTNDPVVFYDDPVAGGKASAKIYSNGSWESLGSIGFSDGAISMPRMTIDGYNKIPVVSFLEETQSDALHVMSYGPYNVSVEEWDANEEPISIYPNPLSGSHLFISEDKFDDKAYQFFNLQGQEVAKGKVTEKLIEVPATLAKGIYTLQIDGNAIKIIIQ